MEAGMSLVMLVPLLPLLAAIIVLIGKPDTKHERARRVGVPALVAAFLGSVVTLALVASQGPYIVRFYGPSSIANLALPLAFTSTGSAR